MPRTVTVAAVGSSVNVRKAARDQSCFMADRA
jgi:hypothetical protein